jgi:teichuronic acid biosynthesis glycosyltransferase TuaC
VLNIVVLTKRQYMNKDLIDDRFGRFREIPLELARMGHRVTGLCLSYRPRARGWISDGTVLWRSVNAGRLKFFGLSCFMAQAQRLAKGGDVIWACSDSFYGIIGHVLSRRYGIPFVFDLYDNFEYYLIARLPVLKQLYRWVIRECDVVTCVSKPLERLVRSYGRHGPVYVMENAVRRDLFMPLEKGACRERLNLPRGSPIIGAAGAIFRNRGILTLFEAFERLKAKHPDLRLALAGPRDMEIPQLPGVIDLGILPLENVPLLLNALDVAVICNRENDFGRYCFPQKACEVMACSVPIIAARVGSMKERLADYPEWLFTPDDPGALARTLEHRLNDRRTAYPPVLSWADLANGLEKIMASLVQVPDTSNQKRSRFSTRL